MKTLQTILKDIKNGGNYSRYYVENANDILDIVKNIDGIKTDTYIDNFNEELDRIRFSSVFADFTNIYSNSGGKSELEIMLKKNGEHLISAHQEIISKILHENSLPVMYPGFMARNQAEVSLFLKTIEPLFEIEKALYHNTRIVMGLTDKKTPDGKGKVWEVFDIDPNSPFSNWMVMDTSVKNNSMPIDFGSNINSNNEELFEISIPYLKGVSFKDLALILKDNDDLLSGFRKNLKIVIENAKQDNKTILEMKNDIVRPEVDKISHKFSTIKNMHKLKVAGTTISTVTLGLLSYSTMGIGSILSGCLGSGGLGLLLKHEADFQKEVSDLKENPYYLMWKFKNEKIS